MKSRTRYFWGFPFVGSLLCNTLPLLLALLCSGLPELVRAHFLRPLKGCGPPLFLSLLEFCDKIVDSLLTGGTVEAEKQRGLRKVVQGDDERGRYHL
jgi:hypothetical protein